MLRLASALGLGLLCAACGSGPVAGRQVSITESGLTYKATPGQGYGGTDKFEWDVASAQVYVRYAGTALTQGTVQVTFLDAAGTVVLHQSLAPGDAPAPGPSSQGKVGPWTVRLDYDNAEGTVAFSAAQAQ